MISHWALALVRKLELAEISRGNRKISNLGENRTQDLRIWSSVALPTELRGQTGVVGDFGGKIGDMIVRGTYECCAASTKDSIDEIILQWTHEFSTER